MTRRTTGGAETQSTYVLQGGRKEVAETVPVIDDAALASLIDMRKPIVAQVASALRRPVSQGGMNKDMYLRWVHTPHYYKEEPKYMRFFESDQLEIFSKVDCCHARLIGSSCPHLFGNINCWRCHSTLFRGCVTGVAL